MTRSFLTRIHLEYPIQRHCELFFGEAILFFFLLLKKLLRSLRFLAVTIILVMAAQFFLIQIE